MRLNPILVITFMFGVFFIAMTGLAWARGKWLSAAFLGVLAAVDLAIALDVALR